tara:strand:- start:220 stop:399 length:180 start_codon:yes stop_codon:yes gene_type:complete
MDIKSLERRFKILSFLYLQIGIKNNVLEKLGFLFENEEYEEFEVRITEIEERVISVLEG